MAVHFALLTVAALQAAAAVSQPLPTAIIDSGAIVGTTTTVPSSTATVNKYLGIPFAAPPTRFRPAEPVFPWSTSYDATKWGPACIQQLNGLGKEFLEAINMATPEGGEDKDCLNLNVFTPASASAGSKAVLVWIHGGLFRNGASAFHQYDGSSLAARQDVVVVSINYRTNAFGFPADPQVPLSERNLGLLDQRLALDWIQRNIAGLGGNPSQVTIMGESSGAASVDSLILSPPNPIPFRAAIMQSGQASVKEPTQADPKEYITSWKTLAQLANCPANNTLSCLRDLPTAKLTQIIQNETLAFGPIPDNGHTFLANPRHARLNSSDDTNTSIARIPILIGNNADEAKPYIINQNDTREFLLSFGISRNITDLLISHYPLGTPDALTEPDRLSLILNDMGVYCPVVAYSHDTVEAGIPTWRYFFNASFPNNEIFPGSGAYHAAEIPYVFGTYERENATDFEHEVSSAMQKAWADFAKDPAGGPGWEQMPVVGVFGDGVKAGMSGEGRRALRTVESGDLDRRCKLYGFLIESSS